MNEREFSTTPDSQDQEFLKPPQTERFVEVSGERVRTMRYQARFPRPVETVLLPGWGATVENYEKLSQGIVRDSSHNVTTVELAHGVSTEKEHPRFREATMRKVAAADGAIEHLYPDPKEKVDLLAHSEGGVAGACIRT